MAHLNPAKKLSADELQQELAGGVIGHTIIALEKTTSTNDAILRMATRNQKEGLVVFAEHQTAGRGQRGNQWQSAARKGLWFSVLLRPQIEIAESARLTDWAAKSVADTIAQEFSLTPDIKPPNDVYIAGRKVAGVLVDMRAQKQALHLAIAGIGINLNQAPEDFPPELQTTATSLAILLQRPVDRQKFAAAVLRNLNQTYRAAFAS